MPATKVPEITPERVAVLRAKPVLTYREAFELMQISETAGYRMVARGEFPSKVIEVGPRNHRVPTAALLRALGEDV
jgi:predicted DNA-binding transcriptional regulator AlpA